MALSVLDLHGILHSRKSKIHKRFSLSRSANLRAYTGHSPVRNVSCCGPVPICCIRAESPCGLLWLKEPAAWLRGLRVQRGIRERGRSAHPPSWLTVGGWGFRRGTEQVPAVPPRLLSTGCFGTERSPCHSQCQKQGSAAINRGGQRMHTRLLDGVPRSGVRDQRPGVRGAHFHG
jgi:hypothetical protein